MLNHVQRSHGYTRSIGNYRDLPPQLDKSQAQFFGFEFQIGFFTDPGKIFMAIEGIVINCNFGIGGDQHLAAPGQGVNLHQLGIQLSKQLVELRDQNQQLFLYITGNAQAAGHFPNRIPLHPKADIDRPADHPFLGDLLHIHAPIEGDQENRAAGSPVHGYRQIEFLIDR